MYVYVCKHEHEYSCIYNHEYIFIYLYMSVVYKYVWGFPGAAVVKNPPVNAGDMGSNPGPGRSHMPWNN